MIPKSKFTFFESYQRGHAIKILDNISKLYNIFFINCSSNILSTQKKSVFHMQNIRVNSEENNPNSFGHKKE
jgi:hypothetical protein